MQDYCTYFDHRYLPRALLLHDSLMQHSRPFRLWALCMDTTDAKVGATQFAAYTSLTNLSTVVGAKLLGANVLTYLSFQQTYILAALLQLVIVGLLPFVKPRR